MCLLLRRFSQRIHPSPHTGAMSEVHPLKWVGRYYLYRCKFTLRFSLRHALPGENGCWRYRTSDDTLDEPSESREYRVLLWDGEEAADLDLQVRSVFVLVLCCANWL